MNTGEVRNKERNPKVPLLLAGLIGGFTIAITMSMMLYVTLIETNKTTQMAMASNIDNAYRIFSIINSEKEIKLSETEDLVIIDGEFAVYRKDEGELSRKGKLTISETIELLEKIDVE